MTDCCFVSHSCVRPNSSVGLIETKRYSCPWIERGVHSAQNFSVLNRIALNLLKQDKSSKRGVKGKRLKAAWNHPYLLKLLGI